MMKTEKILPSLQQISLGHFDKNKVFIKWEPKIIVTEHVERIIRNYCARLPENEWSGVLFYKTTGDFKSRNLVITCTDIYMMDIGTSAFTEFDFTSPDIATYMAENPDLLECKQGLIHSHDRMQAFFSGQDTSTLNNEGNDTVNFVSLIVNDAGSYVAAITRKSVCEEEIKSTNTYNFYGETVKLSPSVRKETKEVIEYIMCDVEVQQVHEDIPDYMKRLDFIDKSNTSYRDRPKAVADYGIDKDWESHSYWNRNKDYKGISNGVESNKLKSKKVNSKTLGFPEYDFQKGDFKKEDTKNDYSKTPGELQDEYNHEREDSADEYETFDFDKIDVKKSNIEKLTLSIYAGSPFINFKNCKGAIVLWHTVFPVLKDFTTYMDAVIENIIYGYKDPFLKGKYEDTEQAAIVAYKIEEQMKSLKTKNRKEYVEAIYDILDSYWQQ